MLNVIALVFCILVGYLYNKMKKDRHLIKSAESIPGPRGLPLLGNSLKICFTESRDVLNVLQKYREKYGSIFKLWVGKNLIIYVSDVNDLEVVFKSSKTLARSELVRPFKYLDGFSSAPPLMEVRKIYQSAFVNKDLPSYVSIMNEEAGKLVDTMMKLVDSPEFRAWDYVLPFYNRIIIKSVFGTEQIPDETIWQFHDNIKKSFETSHYSLFRPWLQIKPINNFLFGKRIIELRQFMLTLAAQIVNLMNKTFLTRKDEVHVDDENSVLLTKLQSAIVQSVIGPVNVLSLISGGTISPSLATQCFLLAVAANPEIQDKLYEEIYTVFGNADRPINIDDMPKLPYLDKVLNESFRRFSFAPVIFRRVEDYVKIGEHTIAPGASLMIPIAHVHFNEDHYPNPYEFNPENFSSEAVEKRHKYAFLAFSAGRRDCVAKNYSILELKIVLIALLRKFKFRTSLKLEEFEMFTGILGTPQEGKISITLRE